MQVAADDYRKGINFLMVWKKNKTVDNFFMNRMG